MTWFTDLLSWKRVVYGGTAFLFGLTPPLSNLPLLAADSPAVRRPEQSPCDWMLTNVARRAIQKDEQLGALNLGVSVNNKVASIWGTIPSLDAVKRAEKVLKEINGITTVKNDCRVIPYDTLPQEVAAAVKKGPVAPAAPAPSMAQLTMWPPPPPSGSQVVAKPNPDELAPKPNVEELAPKPRGDENEVVAGAPLLANPPVAVLLAPVPFAQVGESGDCETVRRSEPRFKDIKLDVQAGIVKINGVVTRMKDAWDLAEKLNALAGVKQVLFGNVAER